MRVASMDKIREVKLRWLGYVKRRCERLATVGSKKVRGRPKKN